MKLHKYWFKFSLSINDPHPIGTLMGCGVTAETKDEALDLLRKHVFAFQPMPSVEKCVVDVEMSDLDAKHVLPNIGDASQKGIWFPLGYQTGADTSLASE